MNAFIIWEFCTILENISELFFKLISDLLCFQCGK